MEGITEINKEDYIDDCVKIVKELVVDEEFSDEKNIASPCPAGDGGGRPGADRCRAHGQHEGVGCVGIDARTRPGRVRPPDGRPRFDGCRRDRPDDFDVRGYE